MIENTSWNNSVEVTRKRTSARLLNRSEPKFALPCIENSAAVSPLPPVKSL